jgi:hypothetical protein
MADAYVYAINTVRANISAIIATNTSAKLKFDEVFITITPNDMDTWKRTTTNNNINFVKSLQTFRHNFLYPKVIAALSIWTVILGTQTRVPVPPKPVPMP